MKFSWTKSGTSGHASPDTSPEATASHDIGHIAHEIAQLNAQPLSVVEDELDSWQDTSFGGLPPMQNVVGGDLGTDLQAGEGEEGPNLYVGPDRRRASFVEYSFGLKDIVGVSREYKSAGLFVAEPVFTKALSSLAIQCDTEYPSVSVGGTSVELLVRKDNFDDKGNFLDSEIFPVLPYGEDTQQERLFLRQRVLGVAIDDTAEFRFYPDFAESFSIARDGVALTVGTDYYLSVDEGTTWESVIPPTATPKSYQTCQVKFAAPKSSSIYLASYTPALSSMVEGGEVYVNKERTTRLERFQTYRFSQSRATGKIAKCLITLQVILRANTLNTRVSPIVRKIIFLMGNK